MKPNLKIGSRGSALALRQVDLVIKALNQLSFSMTPVVVPIRTTGDEKQNTGGQKDKKEWILEIEHSLLNKEIDCAIHSSKDVPLDIAAGTKLLPVLTRHNALDVFIGKCEPSVNRRIRFSDLKPGALLGSSSVRRERQLRKLNSTFRVEAIRGNVQTRIQKLDIHAEMQGIVLARAGVERLGLDLDLSDTFSESQMLPAVNQGILLLQYREGDTEIENLFSKLIHRDTLLAWHAERKVIERLEADCSSAVGVFAQIVEGQLVLRSQVLGVSTSNTREIIDLIEHDSSSDLTYLGAQKLGSIIAERLLKRGASKILRSE